MTPLNGNDQQLQEREKFVLAFNDTMLKIWREQMTLLGVIDTGRLLHSPKSLPVRADGRFIELGLSQSFPRIWPLAELRYGQRDSKR